jgi:hypothetical protein
VIEAQDKLLEILADAWPKPLTASQIAILGAGVCHKRAVEWLPKMKGEGLVRDVPRSFYFAWTLTDAEAHRRGLKVPHRGEVTPSRTDVLADRPPYVHVDMQPARHGATDAFMIPSKRQYGYYPYRVPLALTCQKS